METYSHRHVLIGKIHLVFSCARYSVVNKCLFTAAHSTASSSTRNHISGRKIKPKFMENSRTTAVTDDAFLCCDLIVILFGIIGNVLVIISLVRQKRLSKNNSYFLILQLTICDLAVLIIYFQHDTIKLIAHALQFSIYYQSTTIYFLLYNIYFLFLTAGIGMMLVISVFRYRVVVQLKPAPSRRKVKIVCCLVYAISFFLGYGPTVPSLITYRREIGKSYDKYHCMYVISCYYTLPPLFMAVIYYKIYRKLIQQYNCMKSECLNRETNGTPASFNILTSMQNRRILLILLCTVLCYAVGHIPASVCFILRITEKHRSFTRYVWFEHFADVFRLLGSHAINPLIYGILDKKLLSALNICSKRKRKARFIRLVTK